MKKIDLREVTTRVITTGTDTLRASHMSRMLEKLGIPFRFETGVGPVGELEKLPMPRDLVAKHLKVVHENRERLPLLVFEDDCAVTKAYTPVLTVPCDADLLFLGYSRWGLIPELSPRGLLCTTLARSWRGDFSRVYNMVCTHALLYLTPRSIEIGIAAYLNAFIDNETVDGHLARLQPEMITLAPSQPLFAQADFLQSEQRRAILNQQEHTSVELPVPAIAEALRVDLDGAIHCYALSYERQTKDPFWRHVNGLPNNVQKYVDIKAATTSEKKGIDCTANIIDVNKK